MSVGELRRTTAKHLRTDQPISQVPAREHGNGYHNPRGDPHPRLNACVDELLLPRLKGAGNECSRCGNEHAVNRMQMEGAELSGLRVQ